MSLIFRPARDGSPNLFDPLLNLSVHSAYDPRREAYRLIHSNFSKTKIPAIYGFGAGYLIQALIEDFQFDSEEIFCIRSGLNEEIIPEIQPVFQDLLRRALSRGKSLRFCDVSLAEKENCNIYILPYYMKKRSEERLKSVLNSSPSGKGINESTKSFFSRIWFRNYLINIEKYIEDSSSFFLTERSFQLCGRPVLFIGASPVLERQINKILERRDSFFIICSDTASRFVCRQGIVPDLILSLDSGRGTLYHIADAFPETVPILTWFGANREIFNLRNTKVVYLSSFPLDQLLSSFSEGKLDWLKNPGLNISGMAKSVSTCLKASACITAGTGFVSESGKSHCRGTGYERYSLDRILRKTSAYSLQTKVYSDKISLKNRIAENFLSSPDSINTYTIDDFSFDAAFSGNFPEDTERFSGKEVCRKLISVLQNGLYSQEIEKNSGLKEAVQRSILKKLILKTDS